MSIDPSTLVFFDASCLVAGAGSPTGGSGFVLSICGRGFLRAAVSQPVLLEAERNIVEQLARSALDTYHTQPATTPMTVVPLPPVGLRQSYAEVVGEKDEHVLAAAVEGQVDYLLTLDKRLQLRVNQSGLSIHALSPGEFIKTVLPEHVDFRSLR